MDRKLLDALQTISGLIVLTAGHFDSDKVCISLTVPYLSLQKSNQLCVADTEQCVICCYLSNHDVTGNSGGYAGLTANHSSTYNKTPCPQWTSAMMILVSFCWG